jgi:hypothetical protein
MRALITSLARAVALVALAVFGLVACGEDTSNGASTGPVDPERTASHPDGRGEQVGGDGDGDLRGPPDVRVRFGDEFVDLSAWTFCYTTGCVDGGPPPSPPDVGSPEQVVVEFPLEGWTFKASFQPAGRRCARSFPAKLDEIGSGQFVLHPAGYADEYDVTLFGRGPGGDLFVTFRWTTLTDGPLPTPSSYAALIAGDGAAPDSYGVEMAVNQLAQTPDRVNATVTVTAADGDSLTFAPRLTRSVCPAEGSLWWDGPDAKGEEAAALGPAPFTYDVVLVLDGQTYEADATWPDDVIRGAAPNVRLDFSPDLPALS